MNQAEMSNANRRAWDAKAYEAWLQGNSAHELHRAVGKHHPKAAVNIRTLKQVETCRTGNGKRRWTRAGDENGERGSRHGIMYGKQ
jgi:hypothetical protein